MALFSAFKAKFVNVETIIRNSYVAFILAQYINLVQSMETGITSSAMNLFLVVSYVFIVASAEKARIPLSTLAKAFNGLDLEEHKTLEEAEELMAKYRDKADKLKKIHECFDPTFESEKIHIFNTSLHDVIHKFFDNVDHDLKPVEKDLPERLEIITTNLKRMIKLVEDCVELDKANKTVVGITSMMLLSDAEYPVQSCCLRLPPPGRNYSKPLDLSLLVLQNGNHTLPEEFSWLAQGKVTAAKNQLDCGSCYIFSAVGSLESMYMIYKNKSVVLSEQAILNCIETGCSGGLMDDVWDYIAKNGASSESKCPYDGWEQQCVKYPSEATVKSYILKYDENELLSDLELQEMVYYKGPISVAIDANAYSFRYVKSVFNDFCFRNINHAVLIVGWTKDEWIVKNSWGTSWGDKGFFRMPRGKNKCGINSLAGYPSV